MTLASASNTIEITDLVKTYQVESGPVEVLKGLNMTVKKGEFVAIMGPSGSGKSTLMHIIGALDVPTSGHYILDGQDVSRLTDDQLADIRNQKIGFVFQAFNLLSRTSVLNNVMLPGIYGGLSIAERTARAQNNIEAVGLSKQTNQLSNQLSGGQQQRVAIARALIMNPQIILADEPTGNLPPDQTDEIMSIFTKLNQEGHTIIVITHEPEVASYAGRVIHIRHGVVDETNTSLSTAAAHTEKTAEEIAAAAAAIEAIIDVPEKEKAVVQEKNPPSKRSQSRATSVKKIKSKPSKTSKTSKTTKKKKKPSRRTSA